MLETERLILRPVEEGDLLKLLELQWDKDVVKYMKFSPLSIEDQKSWFNSLGKSNLAFVIIQKFKEENEIIGLATLNNIDHIHQRASWGMKLKANLIGKGFGFEASIVLIHHAFYYLNLNKVHADYLEENINSEKLILRIGLRKEGLLLKHIYNRGEFKNLVLVGILKEEFYKKNSEELKKLDLF